MQLNLVAEHDVAFPGARKARRRSDDCVEDEYSCDQFCRDLPYILWNTCPLCVCGLMPVLIVCISAIFRLDYATHVNDMGVMLINEMGLSYTVYYTAGCWPAAGEANPLMRAGGLHPHVEPPRCDVEHFEIAAAEFDALSGRILKVENVTRIHARRVEALKVTPDWRFIIFIASLANDIGIPYAVGADERHADRMVPLLTEEQVDALDKQCQFHSQEVLAAAQVDKQPNRRRPPVARLAGVKHLQVIIPGDRHKEYSDVADASDAAEFSPSSWLSYRAAFAFECAEVSAMSSLGGPPSGEPLRFSKLAVVDFELGINATGELDPMRSKILAKAELRFVDTELEPPAGSSQAARETVARLKSQACPRFLPSRNGHELLFVAEDPLPRPSVERSSNDLWLSNMTAPLPSRWIAVAPVPHIHREGQPRRLEDGGEDDSTTTTERSSSSSITLTVTSTALATTTTTTRLRRSSNFEDRVVATFLKSGEDQLPRVDMLGCPEFMPSLYSMTEVQPTGRRDFRDTFVIVTDPESLSVVGVDAQVLAVSLSDRERASGEVSRVHLLYNVQRALKANDPEASPVQRQRRLQLGGCQPIRAAGRAGHMRLQRIWQYLTKSVQLETERNEYSAWLACLTADQRIAIVESQNTEQWINMTIPYPIWSGRSSQDIWCPNAREEACFEVWSNPNPNK